MTEKNRFYEFGEFRLDCVERTLWRGAELVALSPKVFDTLCLLVENQGKVMSKTEMMNELWAGSFVEESNLSQNIYTLRRVLGTDKNGNNFIETVPRRGYRFAAQVRVVEEKESEDEREALTKENDSEKTVTAHYSTFKKTSLKPRYSIYIFSAVPVFLILAFIGFRLFTSAKKETHAPIEKVNFQKLTFTGDVSFPVLSPDSDSFAYVRDNTLFLQDATSPGAVQLNVTGMSEFGFLQFAPDGKTLYFRNREGFDLAGEVFQISRFGGAPKLIAQDVWSGFGFSHDGRQMAFIRAYPNEMEYALIIKNLENGEERKLASYKSPIRFLLINAPAWSHDGKKIALAVHKKVSHIPDSGLIVVNTETGEIEELNLPQLKQVEQVAWLPTDDTLMAVARENQKFFQLWRISYPNVELQRITNDLSIYRSLSLSADGKKMLARQFTIYGHIWIADSDDLESLKQITFGNLNRDGTIGLTWTDEGDIIYASRIFGDVDLWQVRPKDGLRKQLTQNAGDVNSSPTVSVDGKYIFFNSSRSGSMHVWRMDRNGDNQMQITTGEKENCLFPQVSSDGYLYYIQRGASASTIWRKSLIGGKTEMLKLNGKFAPTSFLAVSPDGKLLAFQNLTEIEGDSKKQKKYDIVIIAIDGQTAPRLFQITRPFIVWTSDSSAFDYAEDTSEGSKIWRQSLNENTPPKLILTLSNEHLFNFAWSKNGNKLALSNGQQAGDVVLLTNFE